MASPVSACSSEYDAAETFAEGLMSQINREDVKNMVNSQREMLSRFEKTNEMLINFNMLSANRFAVTSQEFKKHTELMYEMKKDLDLIFKRIRHIKDRLGKTYPEAFKACGNVTPLFEDDEEEEELVVKECKKAGDGGPLAGANPSGTGATGQSEVRDRRHSVQRASSSSQSDTSSDRTGVGSDAGDKVS